MSRKKTAVRCRTCGDGLAHHAAMEEDGCWGPNCMGKPMPCRQWVSEDARPRVETVDWTEPRTSREIDVETAYVGHQHPETANTMQRKVVPMSGTIRREIFDAIKEHGGLTDYELEELLGRSHQSTSGSRNTLMNDGLIVDSGIKRLNRFRNEAIVWKISDDANY